MAGPGPALELDGLDNGHRHIDGAMTMAGPRSALDAKKMAEGPLRAGPRELEVGAMRRHGTPLPALGREPRSGG